MTGAARPRASGFSLLEMLVAIAIMAVGLGMIYRATGSSARNLPNLDRQQRAAVLAESLLALRDAVPAAGWTESGTSAGFTWQVQSSPYPTTITRLDASPLHLVSISIRWSDGGRPRELALQTLKPQRRAMPGERAP